uniref:SGNH domain-containing protein n=1 Tax=Caenorhabditis tropicalis TaxID=1561998 RepID=A0A1I7UKB0_9PELO
MALFWIKIKSKQLPDKLKEEEDMCPKSPTTHEDFIAVSLSIIACCFLPKQIDVLVLRPIVTLATAVLIGCESQNVLLLKSKSLAYIGDISYVLYLLHWPVIAIFLGTTVQSYLFCILATLVPSVLLHHLFEKRYLKMDWRLLIPLVSALILCNSFLQNSVREHSFWNRTFPDGLQEIVEKNTAMLPFSWNHDPMASECIQEEDVGHIPGGPLAENFGFGGCPSGNGTTSIMIIGNSYVRSFRELFRSSFNHNFSEFRYVSLPEGYGFYADSPGSRKALSVTLKQVEQYKPDVIVIIARLSTIK